MAIEVGTGHKPIVRIGAGRFSTVLKVEEVRLGGYVAEKKIHTSTSGVGIQSLKGALRELFTLKLLCPHHNIVDLLGHRFEGHCLVLQLKLFDMDLDSIIGRNPPLPCSLIKKIVRELVTGLACVHEAGIMHRDMKPGNVLISREGRVAICDFGLARASGESKECIPPITREVATRWYQSPEILLGTEVQTTSCDIWAVACVLCEMYLGEPLLSGLTDIQQLFLLYKRFGGAPSVIPKDQESAPHAHGDLLRDDSLRYWPSATLLPDYGKIPFTKEAIESDKHWSDRLVADVPRLPTDALPILARCFRYDPRRRISHAEEVLHSGFFKGCDEAIGDALADYLDNSDPKPPPPLEDPWEDSFDSECSFLKSSN
ncbi:hypothetical protein FOL47_005218 [Perkinsus chesapeaki]|uniref:Cyclin-dependent kinase 2 homolog n=1 Tax=Perkinsus chesapeaki TaxID=330153 RepID=A0A7J6LYC4_PERCH|nr:hypothetical protein FOL47_005218 [Perkinsus chesapeaki]